MKSVTLDASRCMSQFIQKQLQRVSSLPTDQIQLCAGSHVFGVVLYNTRTLDKRQRGLFAHTNDVVGSQIKAPSVMCFFFWCSIPFFLLQTEEQISAEKHYVWVYRLILGLHSEYTSESCSFSSVTPVEVILLPLDHRVVKFQSLFWSAVSAA